MKEYILNNRRFFTKYAPFVLAFGFFAILFFMGLFIYKNFGVPVDEPYQLQLASLTHSYIFNGDSTIFTNNELVYHGSVIELPLFWVATRFTGPETIYIRHLFLYLAFLASLVVFYLISLRLFRNPWWSLLAVCLLAFSPRIFSDAFYNSKDIAFMDVFILAVWTLILNIDHSKSNKSWHTILRLLAHALSSALLIDTRIVGVLIVPITIILAGIAIFKTCSSWRVVFGYLLFYLFTTAVLTILFWPILWHEPIREFLLAFKQMSQFNEYGKGVLFQGGFYPSEALPWQYIPTWIGISTPIIILAGFVFGIGDWIIEIYQYLRYETGSNLTAFYKWLSDDDTLKWLAVVVWMIIPIISIYIFHSVLYNGWRHLFFIYPAIVLFSTRGFSALHSHFSVRTGRYTAITILIAIVLVVGLFEPISFLTRYPRYGTAYFNQLAGDPSTLRQRFEMDYWGLSYKEAIDYILATDSSNNIPIYMADVSGPDYINSGLSPEEEARITIMDSPDTGARYFIGNFSFHPDEYEYADFLPEYFSVNVRGAKILVVYRFQQP